MKGKRVVVIGGGVSGLSAAQELAERGFAVTVYERRRTPLDRAAAAGLSPLGQVLAEMRPAAGGKARSTEVSRRVDGEDIKLPAEHGFRFFPAFYRHVTDTMKRIPNPARGGRWSVWDSLRPTDVKLLASYTRDPVSFVPRFPESPREVRILDGLVRAASHLGLDADDIAFYFGKIWRVLTSCRQRRFAELENTSWFDFIGENERSAAYREYLAGGVTRNFLAARAEVANARIIGEISAQMWAPVFYPQPWRPDRTTDKILDGPTQETWINPWIDHLAATGVRFRSGQLLHSIATKGNEISSLTFVDLPTGKLDDNDEKRLIELRARKYKVTFETYKDDPNSDAARQALRAVAGDAERELFKEARFPRTTVELPRDFDFVVFALPVEQMAKFVTKELADLDPSLRRLTYLRDDLAWMCGIQYYLKDMPDLPFGHVNFVGSPWAVTSIMHSELWADDKRPGLKTDKVRSIISACVSNWNRNGFNGKEAGDCEAHEVALDVWDQMKRALNRTNRASVLDDDMLVGFREYAPDAKWTQKDKAPIPWFNLDDNLTEQLDFSKDFPITDRWREEFERWISQNNVGDPDVLVNAEPLLVNKKGTWVNRPEAGTGIYNMVLAGDYVRTNTGLACMEGANEAARRAVNEILQRSGSSAEPCGVWELDEPPLLKGALIRDQERFARGEPWEDVPGAPASVLLELGRTAIHTARGAWERWNAASRK